MGYLEDAESQVTSNISAVKASNPAAASAFPGAVYGAATSDNPQQLIDSVGGLQHAQSMIAGMNQLTPQDQANLFQRARPEEQYLYLANGYHPSQPVIDAGRQAQPHKGWSIWHAVDDVFGLAGKALGAVNKYVLKPTGIDNVFNLANKPLAFVNHVIRFSEVGLESLVHPDRLNQYYTPDGNLSGAGMGKLWSATKDGESMVWDMNAVLGDNSIAHDTRQIALDTAMGRSQDDLAKQFGPERVAQAMSDPKFNDLVGRLNDEKVSVGRLAANLLGIHNGHVFHLISGATDAYVDWHADPVQKALGKYKEARAAMYEITGANAGEKIDRLISSSPAYADRLQSIADNARGGFDPLRFQAEFPQLHKAGMTEYLAEAARKGNLNTVEDVADQFKKALQPVAAAAGVGTGVGQVGAPLLSHLQITPGILAGKSTLIDALHDMKINLKTDALDHLDAMKDWHIGVGAHEYHPFAGPVDAFKRLTTLNPPREAIEGIKDKAGNVIREPGFDPMGKGAIDTVTSTAKMMGGYAYARDVATRYAAADYFGKYQIYRQLLTDQIEMGANALGKAVEDVPMLSEMKAKLLDTLDKSILAKPGMPYDNPVTGQIEALNQIRTDLGSKIVGIPATEGLIQDGYFPVLDHRSLIETIRSQDFIHRHFGGALKASDWMMNNIWRPASTVGRAAFGMRVGAEEGFLYSMKKGYLSYLQGKLTAHQAMAEAGKLSPAGRALRRLAGTISPSAEGFADDILKKTTAAFDKVAGWQLSEGHRFFAAMSARERPLLGAPAGMNAEAKMSFERAASQKSAILAQEPIGDVADMAADGPAGFVDTMHPGLDVWHKQLVDHQGTPTLNTFLDTHQTLKGENPVPMETVQRVDFGSGRGKTLNYMTDDQRALATRHENQSAYYTPQVRDTLARSLKNNAAYQDELANHLDAAGVPDVVTVYRAGSTEGEYTSVSLSATQARKTAADASGRSAENIKVTPMVIKRDDIVGLGRAGEGELLIRNAPLANDLKTLRSLTRARLQEVYKSSEFRDAYPNHPGLYTDPDINIAAQDMARRATNQMTAMFTDESGKTIDSLIDKIRSGDPLGDVKNLIAHPAPGFRAQAINEARVAELTPSVAREGVREPAVIKVDQDGTPLSIVNGRHRILAADRAGRTDVPMKFETSAGTPYTGEVHWPSRGQAPPQEWLAHNLPEDQWPKALKQGTVRTPGQADNPVRVVVDKLGNFHGKMINGLARNPIYFDQGGQAAQRMFSDGTWDRYARAFGPDVADNLVYQTAHNEGLASRVDSIHDPGLRSQFAEWHRNTIPFWFAHEQFVKRWAKAIINDPSIFRRVQLTAQGLRSTGFIHKDPRGDYMVLPGTGMIADAFGKIPFIGKYMGGSIVSSFNGRIKALSAGLTEGGRSVIVPGVGPAVTIPMKIITAIFPDAKPVENLVSPMSSSRSIWKEIMPSWAANTLDALGQDVHDQKFGTAYTNAIMQMQAVPTKLNADGKWVSGALPENASPGEQEAFMDVARHRARATLILGAVLGYASPVSPTINYATNVTKLNREYTTLVRETEDPGEATRIFFETHPNATINDFLQNAVATTSQSKLSVSNVPIPLTKEVSKWFDNPQNMGLVQKYGAAAAFLLPMDSKGAYDPEAYKKEVASGVRIKLDAMNDQMINGQQYESFLHQTYINRDADFYYNQQKNYYAALTDARNRGDNGAVQDIEAQWAFWKDGGVDANGQTQPGYLTTRPVLQQYITDSTQRAMYRQTVLQNLTDLVNLPGIANPHVGSIRTMLDAWGQVRSTLDDLKGDRSTQARAQRADVQRQFVQWAQGIKDPVAKMVYQSLLSQELVQFEQENATA